MDWSLVLQEWKLLPEVFLKLVSNPMLMLTLALGGITGMIAGMLPGISAVMAMSLLLGFVFRVPTEIGMGLLIAIYVGAMARRRRNGNHGHHPRYACRSGHLYGRLSHGQAGTRQRGCGGILQRFVCG